MSTAIKWQEPPTPKKQEYTRSEENQAILTALEQHPGKWALVKENVNVSVSTLWKKTSWN